MSMKNFTQEVIQAMLAPIAIGPSTGRSDTFGIIEAFIYEMNAASGAPLTIAQMKAAAGYLEIQVGGDTKRRIRVDDWLNIEKYFGLTNVDGQLVIPTHRLDVTTHADKWLGMWGTSAAPAIQHRLTIGDITTLAAVERRDRVTPMPSGKRMGIGVHNKILTKEVDVPASGKFSITDVMSEVMPADTIERIFLIDPDGDGVFGTTKFMTNTNNLIGEASENRLKKIAYDAGRVPQANYLPIELNTKNSMVRGSQMRGIRTLNLIHEFTTVPSSNTVRVIFETMHGITERNPEDKGI